MAFNFLKNSFEKMKNALTHAGSLLGNKIRALFQGPIDDETWGKLEQLLYEADLGVQTAIELTEKVKKLSQQNSSLKGDELLSSVRTEILQVLNQHASPLREISSSSEPLVILIVGVNGNGKTTSTAKLAKFFQSQGKKVLVAAADTFRAAAVEQLDVWAQKLGIDIVKGAPKSDPAAVVFDALSAAKARQAEVVIVDTAGRLQTKIDLMQELEKIKRSCKKFNPESPQETLLVLDATTGQNGIDQAKVFNRYTPITGLILTKLDGTSKGGIVVNIHKQLGIPVKLIGIGEGIDDLELFDPEKFTNALFS
ncbi:signal recognition particle-docking protein FtsY [Parachlamydia acanthamoebae]|uniref:signal recognition particle-docking protein FtsY n=1 Tax=Parachlamydia acanthamoebae TaxID=83552 RepID=UPI0001C17412|nr:signal recognition particle-docking protein FtsY [Parachlamydia acanthamoebae]EFB41031.1 cell division protein FtsY [Parachlamydia acanthamoebae str. Hall's coccus]